MFLLIMDFCDFTCHGNRYPKVVVSVIVFTPHRMVPSRKKCIFSGNQHFSGENCILSEKIAIFTALNSKISAKTCLQSSVTIAVYYVHFQIFLGISAKYWEITVFSTKNQFSWEMSIFTKTSDILGISLVKADFSAPPSENIH